jgi:hypothetical protein
MAKNTFIALHTIAGVLAVAGGALTIRRGSYFGLYIWSLVSCIVFVALAVALDWSGLGAGSRILFVGLLVLGAYMVWRGERARRLLPRGGRPPEQYIDDVGFTLVALVDAFFVIGALDLGAGGYVAGLIAVIGASAGHFAIGRLKRRLLAAPANPAHRAPTSRNTS